MKHRMSGGVSLHMTHGMSDIDPTFCILNVWHVYNTLFGVPFICIESTDVSRTTFHILLMCYSSNELYIYINVHCKILCSNITLHGIVIQFSATGVWLKV